MGTHPQLLDLESNEAMHWMHTKTLPTSTSELQEMFEKFDKDGNG